MSLYRSPTAHRPQIEEVISFAKQLLEAGYRAKRLPVADPDQQFNTLDVRCVFATRAAIARNFFLSDSFLRLRDWEPVPVLKLWQSVYEATQSDTVCEWDMGRLEAAFTEFARVCRPTEPASSPVPRPPTPAAEVEVSHLPSRLQRVYRVLRVAVDTLHQELPTPAISKKRVWEWIKENAPEGYRPPAFDTWVRYIRDVPTVFDQQKRGHRPSARRESVARRDEH